MILLRVKCEYCGNYIEDTDKVCPNCGAPNEHMMRSASGVPKTIGELRAFCAAKKLPLEKMRFFIGQDYRAPKAFGIYQDEEGQFVVYKNKADGSRAVRYRGTDEAYAVNEIYQKLKSEVANQRNLQASRNTGTRSAAPQRGRSRKRGLFYSLGMIFVITIIVMTTAIVLGGIVSIFDKTPGNGYYSYNDSCYYNQNDSWYLYDDDYDTWTPVTVDEELQDNYDDYYETSYYSSDYGVSDFSDSIYYEEPSYNSTYDNDDNGWDNDNDWGTDWDDDDDWDWGDDDWDIGGTDWDSEW